MSVSFALGSFSIAGCPPFAGVVIGERMVAVTALQSLAEKQGCLLSMPETVFGLLQDWERNFAVLQSLVDELQGAGEQSIAWVELDTVKTHAPLLYPRQVFCAGANYRQHVIDLAVAQGGGASTEGMSIEERREYTARMMDERIANGIPYVFTKLPSAITGPYDPIVLPHDSTQPDWELELAVIIGKAARHVSRHDALSYVAGYTIVNDVTSRDKVYRKDMQAIGTDWLAAKSSPTFLPTGPFILPAAFVPDPQQLHLTLKLNGNVMQDEGASDMIFGVARLIEYISSLAELWPGDLICTGSPRGNGMHYKRFLRPGDILEGTITGLGTQRNPCIAETNSGNV